MSITYLSSATRLMDGEQLQALSSEKSCAYEALGLTGTLLYSGGNVISVLEGDDAGVRRMFAEVLTDPRHKDVTVMLEQSIECRDFSDWTMAYDGATHRRWASDNARCRSTGSRADDAHDTLRPTLGLLRCFRRNMLPIGA